MLVGQEVFNKYDIMLSEKCIRPTKLKELIASEDAICFKVSRVE